MSSFSEAILFARNRNKNKTSGKRFKEILEIIYKHDVMNGLSPEQAVNLLEDLGPTFVKLGQIASTHPDILPAEYCDAFAKLRSDVKPMPFETVREVVERELDEPLEDIFSEFDERALGSASIAQVHRAVLKENGAVVAVKVQRPEVVDTVAEDLTILERIVNLYDLVVPESNKISLKELLDELKRTSNDELDFTIEAHNLERFYENNSPRAKVDSPRCYEKYTTSAILTEDYFASPSINELDSIENFSQARRDQVAQRIARNYLEQILEDGFYHADPHAANILITKDFGIEWIDFGMMGELSSTDCEKVLNILRALYRNDAYGLQRGLTKVITPQGPVDHGHLTEVCEGIIEDFVDVDLENFNVSAFFTTLIDSIADCGYKIDPFLITMARALVTLEGTVRLVSKKLNIMEAIREYLRSEVEPGSTSKRVQRLFATSVDSAEAAVKLPTKLLDVVDMMQKGQFKVSMDMDMDRSFTKDIVDAASYFAFAVLAAAMIVGSCILCTTELQPQLLGIPVIGFLGFIFGVALMLYITYRIFRDRTVRKHRK